MLRVCLFSAFAMVLAVQAQAPVAVHGRVLGPNAKPLKDAVVALVPESMSSGLSPIREQNSDAKGGFTFRASEGHYGLTVTAPGCLPHFQNVELKVADHAPFIDILLKKGGHRVRGHVLSAPGHKLEATRIGFSKVSQDSGDEFFGRVKQGRFDITLAPGRYEALVESKGQTGRQSIDVNEALKDMTITLAAEPHPAAAKTLAWIKDHAIPLQGVAVGQGFTDMQPLKHLVGEATVVGLGEATHGSREFFQLKHRMLEFLASEMGFTVFAIEANLPEAFVVNDYVLTGQGDPAKALAGLYFWTWNTEEVLDLIRWMRTYNEDPAHANKLRFYGVDMQTETVAYAQARAWLESLDATEAAKLRLIKQGMAKLPSPYSGKPSKEDLEAWDSAAKDFEALITRLEARKELGDDFDRQRQNLRVLSQFAAMQADPAGGYKVRDAAMAANLRWIQAREHGAKIVLWAHNGHISFHPGSIGGVNGMGWHLRQGLGKAYRPMGFAFREGGFQAMSGDPKNRGLKAFEVTPQLKGTLDAALAATHLPFAALDLQTLPKKGSVQRWLESPQGTWSIGALFTPGQEVTYIEKKAVVQGYDALLFVNHTTRARPVAIRPAELKEPVNLGFETGLTGWSALEFQGYEARVLEQGAKEGTHCLQVVYDGKADPKAWWKTEQAVDANAYRGKKVRLTGWIRTDGKSDFKARFWLRVDGKNGRMFYDNMEQRPVTATEWTEVQIEGPVDGEAVNLTFGCTVMQAGTAWFDGLRVEVVP